MEVKCVNCGVLVVKSPGKPGPISKYCSQRCKSAWHAAHGKGRARIESSRERRASAALSVPDRECKRCGETTPRNKKTLLPREFCSKACADYYTSRKRAESQPPCIVDGCDRPRQGRDMCSSHYSRWWNDRNPRRKQLLRQDYGDRLESRVVDEIPREEVFARDNWTCHLCGGAIPHDAKWPDVLSGQVDHIVPLAKGGDHSWSNVAAAHFGCNAGKRDRLVFTHAPRSVVDSLA